MIGTAVAKFPPSQSVGERYWGEELLLVLSSKNYTMKKLITRAGQKGGLQYHRLKDEANYVISGRLLLRYEDENGVLQEKEVGPNEWFHLPAGCVHQEEAITDVVRIEVSTPHFNDRVRVESAFGINVEWGLPTTQDSEIEIR